MLGIDDDPDDDDVISANAIIAAALGIQLFLVGKLARQVSFNAVVFIKGMFYVANKVLVLQSLEE